MNLPPLLRAASIVLVMAGGFAAILLCLLWKYQERLLFYPVMNNLPFPEMNPAGLQNPAQVGLGWETAKIVSSDGTQLPSWLMYPASGPNGNRATIIFFQGNAGNMGFRLEFFESLVKETGLNLLALSYRGYNHSQGVPSEDGLYSDAEAAVEFVRKRFRSSPIVVFGRSLGGAIAVDVAVRRPDLVSAVVVENTFSSINDMARVVFPPLKLIGGSLRLFLRLQFNTAEKMKFLKQPILIISGLQDALVPPEQMKALRAAVPKGTPLTFLEVPKGTHNDTWFCLGDKYYKMILKFIATHAETATGGRGAQ